MAAITTYCFFEIPEILQFCFYVFDRDKNGFITQEEMRLFVDAMHNSEMTTNVMYALDNIKYKKDGKFDFDEFHAMRRPASNFKEGLRDSESESISPGRRTLGETIACPTRKSAETSGT